MQNKFSSTKKVEQIVEGFGLLLNADLPNSIWHTINLDSSTANKKVEIHITNLNPANVPIVSAVRQIDDTGAPIGIGYNLVIGGKSTTSAWITTNKNAEIQVLNQSTGTRYIHASTLK